MRALGLSLFLGLMMLFVSSCSQESVLQLEESASVREISEYKVYVRADSVSTRLTSVDGDNDGFAEWENGDVIYVALDRDDSKSFKLTYIADKRYFAIAPLGGNTDISSTKLVAALFTSRGSLSYSSPSVSGSTIGDIAYTRSGSCVVDDDTKTVTFTMSLSTRPVSLIMIKGAGGECYVSNMKKSYTKLVSLYRMNWELGNDPSYIYDSSEDAVYCYGVAPDDGTIHLQYVKGDKKELVRTVPVSKNMTAGDMLILNGPASSEASEWSEAQPDYYATGSVYTYSQSTKTKPITLVVLGDGFIADDLKISDCVFYEKARYAMDKMFSVEPYKTYKDYFNVYFIAAVSNDRGADISSLDQTRDTYFNTGWESGKSYTNMTQTGAADFVKNYCPDVKSGLTSLGNVRILILCNETTYGAVCLPYSSPAFCFVSLTGSNTLAWNNYDKSIAGQTRGDYANLVLHEFAGHEVGRLGDEYSGALTSTTKILTYHLRDFGWNLSTSTDSSAPWYDFLQTVTQDGGFDVDTSTYKGLGFYQCGTIEIWRPSFASCMQDNRLFFDAWSRYLIAEEIHEKCGESYSVSQFIREVPKMLNDPTWLVTRSSGDDASYIECPMPAPPVME